MSRAESPYANLAPHAHWRSAVAETDPDDIPRWYKKKFDIGSLPVATAGSCFAQHIGRRLFRSGFNFLDAEKAPSFLGAKSRKGFGYGMYSARYGNIYTTRQLRQLLERATGTFKPKEEYWEKDGGVVDPFRPTIEPQPFGSVEELNASRDFHLECVRKLFSEASVFVFTLGLTEAWVSKDDGAVFPIAPGVSGGRFMEERYRFVNFGFSEVLDDLLAFIALALKHNPLMKFIFTVSPVPLMATASDNNVVVATTYSKSVLRAVAGEIADRNSLVDYFPSFEIVNSHVMRSRFYEADMRTVTSAGVDHVMSQFFGEHTPPAQPARRREAKARARDVTCDEELLLAFGQ